MKYKIIIIFIFVSAAIGTGLMLALKNRSNTETPIAQTETTETSNIKEWELKTDKQADVTVEVVPLDLSPQSDEWKFSISMDTHSVELDQNMVNIAILVDNEGNKYKPIKWEGSPAGGHHREGALIFKAISPIPKSVEFRISSIGDVTRSFNWKL